MKTVKTVHGKKTISKTRHVEVQMNKPKDDEVQLSGNVVAPDR